MGSWVVYLLRVSELHMMFNVWVSGLSARVKPVFWGAILVTISMMYFT